MYRHTLSLQLESALLDIHQWLYRFSLDSSFFDILIQAFGQTIDRQKAGQLQQLWNAGDFTALPQIEVRSQAELKTAKAAYSTQTNLIYISDQSLEQSSQAEVVAVLLEEIGHFIDTQLNRSDTPGDEGALFSALLRGQSLDHEQRQALAGEDDSTVLLLDGQLVPVEQAEVSDSGGFEGSQATLTLESKGGEKAIVSYQLYTIPDQIQLRYEGKNILDTGFIPGSNTIGVEIPQGNSDQLEVILATNNEDTRWNYKVKTENKSYLLFRESYDNTGSWKVIESLTGIKDEIPGWDHVALSFNDRVYESHPGYRTGAYYDSLTGKSQPVSQVFGVQQEHTRGSFLHDSPNPANSPAYKTAQISISAELGEKMAKTIESQKGKGFLYIDYANLSTSLTPYAQKGGAGTYTCVGLVEAAAERAGYNSGQGFIPNRFESFTIRGKTIPLLSPELLAWAVGAPTNSLQFVGTVATTLAGQGLTWLDQEIASGVSWLQNLLDRGMGWLQGFFDPVDFVLTDPLGRRLGHTAATGTLNEIPGALYTGDGKIEQFLILDSIPGDYTLQLFGTGGNALAAVNGSTTTGELFEAPLAQGETRSFKITAPPRSSGQGIADLSVAQADSSGPIPLGQSYTYTLKVSNNSANSATGVKLTESLPSGTQFVEGKTNTNQAVQFSNGVVTANLGNISSGSSATVDLTVKPIAAGNLLSRATVTGNEADPNITNNLLVSTKTVVPTTPAVADLELTQTISNAIPLVGSQINFTLTLTNKGPGTASGIKVTDVLPNGLQFISARTIQGSYDSRTGLWNAGNLRSGLSRTLEITARVTTPGVLLNTAEITGARETDPDSKPGNRAVIEDDQATVRMVAIPKNAVMGIAPPPIHFSKKQRGLTLKGTRSKDNLAGDRKQDFLSGSEGNDRLSGKGDSDRLIGGKGKDALLGGPQRDLLLGEMDQDRLLGQQGADILIGGDGPDQLTGGGGQDLFVFNRLTEVGDRITDFNVKTDLIDLRRLFSAPSFGNNSAITKFFSFVQLTQVGNHTQVRIDSDGQGSGTALTTLVTLDKVSANAVSSRNFVI